MDYPAIILKKGKHSTNTPRNITLLLQKLFYKVGYRSDDVIGVILGERIKACSESPVFALGPKTSRGSFELNIKPDDNSSRHKVYIFPPKEETLDSFYIKVKTAISLMYPTKEREQSPSLKVPISDIIKKPYNPLSWPIVKTNLPKVQEIVVRPIQEVMDPVTLSVLMEYICEKTVNNEIPRKDLIDIIEAQKLECPSTHIHNFLLRRDLIEVQKSKRGILKINWTKAPTHQAVESPIRPTRISGLSEGPPITISEEDIIRSATRKSYDRVIAEETTSISKGATATPMKTPVKVDNSILDSLKVRADKFTNITRNVASIDAKISNLKNDTEEEKRILKDKINDLKGIFDAKIKDIESSIKLLEEEKRIIELGAEKHKDAYNRYLKLKELSDKLAEELHNAQEYLSNI